MQPFVSVFMDTFLPNTLLHYICHQNLRGQSRHTQARCSLCNKIFSSFDVGIDLKATCCSFLQYVLVNTNPAFALNNNNNNDYRKQTEIVYCFKGVTTHILRVLYSQDLFPEVLQVVKCRLRCNGVNQSETLAILHVQVPHRCELFLLKQHQREEFSGSLVTITSQSSIRCLCSTYCSGRVEDFKHTLLPVHLHLLLW